MVRKKRKLRGTDIRWIIERWRRRSRRLIGEAFGVILSTDGQYAYVTDFDNSSQLVQRNASYGALTYGGLLRDGVGGVDGLSGAFEVTLSPDGQHAYVAAGTDNSVSWFERNASSGALTYGGLLRDGVGGVDGLSGAFGVILSTDGQYAYVTGMNDNAVSWFERNASSGALTYGGLLRDGVGGVRVDGWPSGAFDVTLSADGQHAYVAKSDGSNSVIGSKTGNSARATTTPARLDPDLRDAAQVAAGENHSLILKGNGSLWAVGGNQYGELGTGDNVDRNDTVQVVASTGVVQVATGGRSDHSLFLKSDGSLWAMGRNTSGQLGDGANNDRNASVMIATGVKDSRGWKRQRLPFLLHGLERYALDHGT